MVKLVNKPNIAAANDRAAALRYARQILPSHHHIPRIGLIQKPCDMQ